MIYQFTLIVQGLDEIHIKAGLKSRNILEQKEFDFTAYVYTIEWLKMYIPAGQTLCIVAYFEQTITNIIDYFNDHFFRQSCRMSVFSPLEIHFTKQKLLQDSLNLS